MWSFSENTHTQQQRETYWVVLQRCLLQNPFPSCFRILFPDAANSGRNWSRKNVGLGSHPSRFTSDIKIKLRGRETSVILLECETCRKPANRSGGRTLTLGHQVVLWCQGPFKDGFSLASSHHNAGVSGPGMQHLLLYDLSPFLHRRIFLFFFFGHICWSRMHTWIIVDPHIWEWFNKNIIIWRSTKLSKKYCCFEHVSALARWEYSSL